MAAPDGPLDAVAARRALDAVFAPFRRRALMARITIMAAATVTRTAAERTVLIALTIGEAQPEPSNISTNQGFPARLELSGLEAL